MSSMQLKINHIHAQIGINKSDAVLSIRQPKADIEMKTTPGELINHSEQPKIKIDQKQCFSEAGLKDVFELSDDAANLGKEAVLQAIGQAVSEGNRMAMIENKTDAFKEIASDKALPAPAEINITFIPQSRPKITFEGKVDIEYRKGKVDIEIKKNKPQVDVTLGKLEIYLLQKPEFQIEFVGNNVDINK